MTLVSPSRQGQKFTVWGRDDRGNHGLISALERLSPDGAAPSTLAPQVEERPVGLVLDLVPL